MRLIDRSLVGARIDHEQHIAGIDVLAVLEMDFGDAAGDLRLDLGIIDRVDAAGKFREGMNRLRLDETNRHGNAGDRRRQARARVAGISRGDEAYEGGDHHRRDNEGGDQAWPAYSEKTDP